jgi:Xaa-Pro dipeptidase
MTRHETSFAAPASANGFLPNTCFSVEPGLYFPGAASDPNAFGVRSEVDMIARKGKAEVTGRIQTELVRA